MRSEFQRQVQLDPEIGILDIDNARLDSSGGRGGVIRSAFLESLATSTEILQASPGSREPLKLANHFLMVITTNDGSLSPDMLNRALSFHLPPKGDLHDRRSPIGTPRLESLPNNRERIEAEFRELLDRRRIAGCPLDEDVEYPMTRWARTIGGILKHSGFTDFLANQGTRRTVDDPIRRAIGILGAANPGPGVPRGLGRAGRRTGPHEDPLLDSERDTEPGRERAIGIVLSRHLDETFLVETEDSGHPIRLNCNFMGHFADGNLDEIQASGTGLKSWTARCCRWTSRDATEEHGDCRVTTE